MSNTIGTTLRLTTFGESHGTAIGGILDGCPSGIPLDLDAIDADLVRRRTGAPRGESDTVVWLSGLSDDDMPRTLGTPIAFTLANEQTRPDDYDALRHLCRPGHADYTYLQRYGLRDHRGGGRASARETAVRVVAGAIAKQLLSGVTFQTTVTTPAPTTPNDTLGGIVECTIHGVAAGIGNPLFSKLGAALAHAMMTIPSAIGFEMGAGFAAAAMKGSEYIDRWTPDATTVTNHCGGIQGGISNGMPITFRVAFHPVVTIPQPVECLAEDGTLTTVDIGGRHDRYHVPRAAVVVEAMAALVVADQVLISKRGA